jgi:3-dehydroquinate synthase
MSTITVQNRGGRYPVIIEENIISNAGAALKPLLKAKKLFIVTDENVARLYLTPLQKSLEAAGFAFDAYILPAGEASKSIGKLEEILSAMAKAGISRTDAAIALGGGVVGDITGFAAAVYMRGVPYIQIPTTLLAQIDSAIGGKTAVNLKEGKNLAGAFYSPAAVLSDPLALETLSPKEKGEGRAEMIKYACIADAGMFDALAQGKDELPRYIEICCAIKKRTVEEDELDTGIRMILNFGHTIGHAIEVCGCYSYSHGQAVAAGMAHITQKSEALGLTEPGTAKKLVDILKQYDLPHALPEELKDDILAVMARDKKLLSGKLNLVLLKRIGECFIHPVALQGLKDFI